MVFNEEDEHEDQAILSPLTIIKMYRIRDFLLIFDHDYLFSHSIQACLYTREPNMYVQAYCDLSEKLCQL